MPLLPPPPDPFLTQVEEARRAVADQFASLGASLKRQSDEQRGDLVNQLARNFRRLRTFDNEPDWIAAVLDASAPFSFRAVFFSALGGKLEWKAARNVEVHPGLAVALHGAPAFAAAARSLEITIALKTAGELSKALAMALGEEPGEKVGLIPIVANGRAVAILYAEDPDAAGLELVSMMAGSALAVHQLLKKTDSSLLQIGQAAAAAAPSEEDEDLHRRAQRFARLRTSEIRLYDSDNVQLGRRERDLYKALRARIDEAREAYRNQFAAGSSAIVDYLDREIVRALANGDRGLMGPAYPGPLL